MSCTRQSGLVENSLLRSLLSSKRIRPLITIVLSLVFVTLISTTAIAASVAVEWDPNDPTPDGYMIFIRAEGGSYNYNAPSWVGTATNCTLEGLTAGGVYYMVVRAYGGKLQSTDSNEVTFTASEDSAAKEDTGKETNMSATANVTRSNGEALLAKATRAPQFKIDSSKK